MIEAILHGKVASELVVLEGMEDVLTSCVFGLLQHLPVADGIIPFLRKAKDEYGQEPIVLQEFSSVKETKNVKYDFWPKWFDVKGSNGCEPDVVITLRNGDGRIIHVLIEAKLYSEKSSIPDENANQITDQLGREYECLCDKFEDEEFLLIYLTRSASFPISDIRGTREEYRKKKSEEMRNVFWLPWWSLADVVGDNFALRKLSDLIKRMDLLPFRRLRTPEPLSSRWQFISSGYTWGGNYKSFPLMRAFALGTEKEPR